MRESFRFRIWHAAGFLAAVSAVSALSSSKDARNIWRMVRPPAAAPPRWVLPSLWTGLNVLQLWADLRILNNRDAPDRATLIGLRAVGWLLHALFSPPFFRVEAGTATNAATLAEGVTTGATVALLAKSDPLAAAALTPLTLWTAYRSLSAADGAKANSARLIERMRWDGAL